MIRAEGVCKSFDKTDVKEYHIDTFVMGDDWKGKFDYREEWFREDRVIKVVDWLALD